MLVSDIEQLRQASNAHSPLLLDDPSANRTLFDEKPANET
jgi:hypothetical protein